MQRSTKLIASLSLIAYPVLLHLSLSLHYYRVASLIVVSALYIVVFDLTQRWGMRCLYLLVITSMSGLIVYHNSLLLPYLFPLIIMGLVMWFFARTLVKPRIPLITQIAERVEAEMDTLITDYTRRLTLAWVIFLGLLLLENLLLALFAPVAIWSLFSNVLNYVFIASFFTLELIYRRLRYQRKLNLLRLFRVCRHINYRQL